jgi:penicillin amidase
MLSLSLPCHLAIGRLKAHPHLRQALPSYPEDGPCVLDGGACSWEAGLGLLALAAAAREPFGAGPGTGSNSWAAAPARTATGGALLANDPHLPLRLPSVWYQFTLEYPGLSLAGVTMPGIPGALVGQNGRVAWGLTNTMLDDADVYVETVDPADPDRYLTPAGPRPFRVLDEAIAVRGLGTPRRHRIRFTEHDGVRCPVVSDAVPAARDGRVLALRWTGLDAWPVMDVVRRANRARTVADLEEALRDYNVPAQNFVGADADGRITYRCGGRIPRRPLPVSGGPLDGASGRHEWQDVLPFEENPQASDPPAGFLVTANHRVSSLPLFPEPPYRAARIRERLRAEARHTADTFAAIQADVVSLQARVLVTGVLGPLGDRLQHPKARAAAARLLAWDGTMAAERPEPAIFHAWYAQLLRRIIRPPLEAADPGLFDFYTSLFHLAVGAADAIFLGEEPAWYPGGKGPAVEAALLAALEELEAEQGPDPAAWRWGRAHPLTLAHTLRAVGHPLARAVARWLRLNRGPFPHPGDGMTVNLAGYPLNAPYRPQVGPSLRLIADLKDPNASRWVIPGGASGDPLSPHYADQLERWRRGEYLPMRVLPQEEARRTGTALRLSPA